MPVNPSDALDNIRYDDTTDELYEVDGNGNEKTNTRTKVASDIAKLIKTRSTWATDEATKISNQGAVPITPVSTQSGNTAQVGTDGRIYVPTPSATGKSYITLGGIGVLQQKVYNAVLPINENTSITSMSIACGTSGSANITFQLKKIPNGSNTAQNLGSAQTLTAGNTYQSFSFSPELVLVPGDRVQVEVTTSLSGITAPTRVTVSLVTKVG